MNSTVNLLEVRIMVDRVGVVEEEEEKANEGEEKRELRGSESGAGGFLVEASFSSAATFCRMLHMYSSRPLF